MIQFPREQVLYVTFSLDLYRRCVEHSLTVSQDLLKRKKLTAESEIADCVRKRMLVWDVTFDESLLQMDKQKENIFKVQENEGMDAIRRVCNCYSCDVECASWLCGY